MYIQNVSNSILDFKYYSHLITSNISNTYKNNNINVTNTYRSCKYYLSIL